MIQKSNISVCFVCFVIAVCFYLFNSATPYYSDDWWYSFIHQPDYSYPTERVENVGDIVTSQINHYNTVNGRLPVTFVAQAIVSFCPKWIFNILNTIIFVLASLLTARLVTPQRLSPRHIITSAAALFLLLPGHYETMLWATGAINYLWVGTLILSVLFLWHKLHTIKIAGYLYPPIFIMGFIAGWSNEALSFGLAAGVAIELLFNHKKLSAAHITLAIGIIAGACMILIAPGSWNRLETISQPTFSVEKYQPLLWALVLPATLAGVLWFLSRCNKQAFRFFITRHRISLTAATVLLPICLATYQYAGRSFFGMALFCLIPLLDIGYQYVAPRATRVGIILFYIAMALFIGLLYNEHCKVEQTHRALIETYAGSPDGSVALNTPQRAWFALPYTLNLDNEYRIGWTATHMAAYYQGKPLQWISTELNASLNNPQELFTAAHKVAGNNRLYTTDDIEYYVLAPDAARQDSLTYHYANVSFGDDVAIHSRILRLLAPQRYPSSERLPAYYTTIHINNIDYICIAKNRYRNVTRIENNHE